MGSISMGRTSKANVINGDYGVQYNYDVRATLNGGIPGTTIEWCNRNITNPWGWYFDKNNKDIGYLTFTNKKDATLVALRYLK